MSKTETGRRTFQLMLPGYSINLSEQRGTISKRQLRSMNRRLHKLKLVHRSHCVFTSPPQRTQADVTAVVLSKTMHTCRTHVGGCREGLLVVSKSGASPGPRGEVILGDVVVHTQMIHDNCSISHLCSPKYGSNLAKNQVSNNHMSKGIVFGKLSAHLLEHNLKSLLSTHSPSFELAHGANDGLIWLKAPDARNTIHFARQLSSNNNRTRSRVVGKDV